MFMKSKEIEMIREEECKGVRNPPKPVYFKYPEGTKIKGRVIKEVRKKYKSSVIGDYCAVVQLIEHPMDENCVRFGYYRKKPGTEKFKWASQTTYEFPVGFTKELIKKAKKEGIL